VDGGRILLIDTVESIVPAVREAADVPVEWASYGHPYKAVADHFELFRDLREFPVIVDDSLNVYDNWKQDRQEPAEPESGRPGAPAPPPTSAGSRLGFPLSRYAFAWRVRGQYEEALRAGAVMVAFAGPPHAAELPPRAYAHLNPDLAPVMHLWGGGHWPEALSNYGALPIDEPDDFGALPGPASVQFRPGRHAYGRYFASFAARFQPQMRWYAAWDAFGYGGRRQNEEYHPLFWNSAGRQVGFVREHFVDRRRYPQQRPGLTVVLPNVEPAGPRTEAILLLVGEVLPHLRPELFPAHWYHAYLPPGLAARRADLARRRAQVERELRAEERSIEAAAKAFEEYKPLLRLTGDPLKELVAGVFGRAFGLRVTDLDRPTLLSDPAGPVLLLEDQGFRALAEVRGFERRTLTHNDVRAFVRAVGRFVARHGQPDARLLVVNLQAQVPPERRAPLSGDVVRAAAREGIVLLPTDALLGLVERWRASELDMAGLKARLATPGELRL
jgi:hypothetical protein